MNFYESVRNNLKESDDYVYGFEEIIDTIGSAEEYSEIYDAISHILDDDIRVDAEQSVEQCEEDGDDVETASSIVCSDVLDKWRYDENTPTTRKDYLASSKKESEKVKESVTYLEPQYDSRGSFYRKATVEDNGTERTLYSYNIPIMKIVGDTIEMLCKDTDLTTTTLRHIREFLQQNGLAPMTRKELVQLINSNGINESEKLKESFFNPGKYFQLLQDIEDEYVDFDKWNYSNQEQRDAMVRPALEKFWETYREEMTQADIDALYDDLEDSNYHTEYRILEGIINDSMKDKFKTESVETYSSDGDEDAEVADYVDFNCDSKLQDGVNGEKILRKDDFDTLFEQGVKEAFKLKDEDMDSIYDKGILPNGQDLWDFQTTVRGILSYRGYETIYETDDERNAEEGDLVRIVGGLSNGGIESQLQEKDGNWIVGKVWIDGEEYRVNAKVFNEGSEFGIDNGTVSKLWIAKDDDTIVNYDRGWDVKPPKEFKGKYEAILSLVEEYRLENPIKESESLQEKDNKKDYEDYCKDLNLDPKKKSSKDKYIKDYGKNYATTNGIKDYDKAIKQVKKDLKEEEITGPFSHDLEICYGKNEDGSLDTGNVLLVVDNREDFPELSDEELHNAITESKPSIWFNDATGKEEMFDIKVADGKYWLMYTGKEDGNDRYHFIIDKNAFNESVKEELSNIMKEANIKAVNGIVLNESNYTMGSCISQIKAIDDINGFYDKVREIVGYNDKEWNEKHGWEDFEIKRLQREADARYEELKNQSEEKKEEK